MMRNERVLAAMQTQADTVARLERERNQAWDEFRALSVRAGAFASGLELNLAAVIQRAEAAEAKLAGYKADAEALQALAAWSSEDVRLAEFGKHDKGWYVWLYEYEVRVIERVSGATLAAAIMDALGKVGR